MDIPKAPTQPFSFGPHNSGAQFGVNNGTVGDIHSHYYASPLQHRKTSPPGPFNTIPFLQDRGFIQRGKILQEVALLFEEEAARVALVGLGGAGKSQLAIHFAYQQEGNPPSKYVFWIHAATRARFEESYREIAERLDLMPPDKSPANVLELVPRWLKDPAHGPWVMVVDNADDINLFKPGSESEPLTTYIPDSPHGRVLITTRNGDVAFELTGQRRRGIFEIGKMSDEESLSLFNMKREEKHDTEQDKANLLDMLGHIPLAIAQAASFLDRLHPYMSITEYIRLYHDGPSGRMSIFGKGESDRRRDKEMQHSIARTWEISLDHVYDNRRTAADLFSLMSCFHWRAIPTFVLQTASKEWDRPTGRDPRVELSEDITYLQAFCLVSRSTDPELLDIHPLVHSLTRDWVSNNSRSERWDREFFKAMEQSSGKNLKQLSWNKSRAVLPHVESAMARKPRDEHDCDLWMRMLRAAERVARIQSQPSLEAKIQRSILSVTDEPRYKYGKQSKHYRTVARVTVHQLLLTLYSERYTVGSPTAEETRLLHRAMCQYRSIFEPDPLSEEANTACDLLCCLLLGIGQVQVAYALVREALDLRQKHFEEDHSSIINLKAHIAEIHAAQGQHELAAREQRMVLKMYERSLGPKSYETVMAVIHLVRTEARLGRYEVVEILIRRAWDTTCETIDKKVLELILPLHELATALFKQGRSHEAEELFRADLEEKTQSIGPDNTHTKGSARAFIHFLNARGRVAEANALCETYGIPLSFVREFALRAFTSDPMDLT